MPRLVTRFAPSPTGRLHLGHAYSALVAWEVARRSGGRFLLRIEDIDDSRCRPEFEQAIYDDLAWLGVAWEPPVRRQSEHPDDYRRALGQLDELRVLYPCFCSRKSIRADVDAIGLAPHGGEVLYPGTCRELKEDERRNRIAAGEPYALRLDVAGAWRLAGENLTWRDRLAGEVRATPGDLGDVVLARRDTGTSYHLAVTVDDALQGINLVVRGDDLFPSTHIHRLLQALLGLPTPEYLHHDLVTDEAGVRLAKRDGATALQALREAGWGADDVRRKVGLGGDAT
jgi:glutamyl-Q tRNA(Asp) synthetase